MLRPHFRRKYITKDDYKEIMRKSVSKVCIQMKGIGRVCHNIIVFFVDLQQSFWRDKSAEDQGFHRRIRAEVSISQEVRDQCGYRNDFDWNFKLWCSSGYYLVVQRRESKQVSIGCNDGE